MYTCSPKWIYIYIHIYRSNLGSPTYALAQTLSGCHAPREHGTKGVAALRVTWSGEVAIFLQPAISHWIDLRENLQETMVFTIKYRAFL